MDVSSLYTNIPHDEGIDACRSFLNRNTGNTNTSLSVDSICKLIELTLKNNHFKFNNDNYIQTMGTAMGSPFAPAYASLFMGKLEQDFLQTRQLKPTLWLRFLDDIFMIWDHSLDELNDFVQALNGLHSSIKFTYDISLDHISFLDVDVTKDNRNNICTNVHVKNTNIHQYLDYSSNHPKTCKNGIPYSQAKRYRRIVSDDDQFAKSLDSLREFFISRGYPDKVIDDAFGKVRDVSQDEALVYNSNSSDEKIVPFIIEYSPSLPHIGSIVKKYWDLFKLSQNASVQHLHEYRPVLAYQRGKNLKDFLVRSTYPTKFPGPVNAHSSKCSRPRCSHCTRIVETDKFESFSNSSIYRLKFNTDCTSNNVIYLISCKKCNMQYVGQTKQQVSKRMNSHRFDIKNFSDPVYASGVATHFNTTDHSVEDFSFLPIDIVDNDMDRLVRETSWIHRLDTVFPSGMNTSVLFKL
jgi:hypothetical protein